MRYTFPLNTVLVTESSLTQHEGVGCGIDEPTAPPQEGDLRLLPTSSYPTGTQPCEDYHAGAVQMFRNGTWGGICRPRGGLVASEKFTLDTQVICRQLGFPYGTVLRLEKDDIAAAAERNVRPVATQVCAMTTGRADLLT